MLSTHYQLNRLSTLFLLCCLWLQALSPSVLLAATTLDSGRYPVVLCSQQGLKTFWVDAIGVPHEQAASTPCCPACVLPFFSDEVPLTSNTTPVFFSSTVLSYTAFYSNTPIRPPYFLKALPIRGSPWSA
jgi:hypothetical protein